MWEQFTNSTSQTIFMSKHNQVAAYVPQPKPYLYNAGSSLLVRGSN
ncbi:hypothetical protein BVRB_5g117420 [Beta vulgaris subsp. vulgaris]|nr:hypothetical protein BVRB_5g117420 [Beta vulgaris subsp. vulgaris]